LTLKIIFPLPHMQKTQINRYIIINLKIMFPTLASDSDSCNIPA
jgi:hypothetical protein